MQHTRKKKLLALVLALVMVLGLLPVSAGAAESTPEPEQSYSYIENIQWRRMPRATGLPLHVRSEEYPYLTPFRFDPAVTEYDLVIPFFDTNKESMFVGTTTLDVTFSDAAKAADPAVYGRVSDVSVTADGQNNIVRYSASAADFAAIGSTIRELALNGGAMSTPQMMISAANPCTIQVEAGVLNGDVLEQPGPVYTFHIYRIAALTGLTGAYADAPTVSAFQLGYSANMFAAMAPQDYYNIVFNGVKSGTESLLLTPTYGSTDFTLRFDDGTGSGSCEATGHESGTQFALDLTKYKGKAAYEQEDGSLVIPFLLDYDQTKGCCLDGYYTLTLKFEEPTPAAENSEISPSTAGFDKYAPEDIAVTLTLNGNSFSGVYAGETQLTAGTDYSVAGDTVTLKKEYLAALGIGEKVLTFKFSAGEDKTLTLTVSDSTPAAPGQNGYVKNILIGPSRNEGTIQNSQYYLDMEHIWLNSFTPEQTEYALGSFPVKDVGPAIALELADDTLYESLYVSLTLTDGNGTVCATGSGGFNKASYIYKKWDHVNDAYSLVTMVNRNLTGSFSQIGPGNFTLTIKVYAEGQENNADTYTFTYALTPHFDSLRVYAADSLLSTDPNVQERFDATVKAIVPYQREYSLTSQGALSLTLEMYVFDWLNQYGIVGSASGDVYLQFNETTYPAQILTLGLSTTLTATLDISGCAHTGNVYTVPFSLVYGEGAMKVQTDYTLTVTVTEASGWAITGVTGGGTYNKGETATVSVIVEGDKADNVTYQWQWTEQYNDTRFDQRNRGDIENATSATLNVPTVSSGRRFYRCVVTDKDSGNVQYSDYVTVDVNLGKVNAPVICVQPGKDKDAKTEYTEGEALKPILVTAGTTDMVASNSGHDWLAEMSIQWYQNVCASVEGATLLDEKNYATLGRSNNSGPLPTFSDFAYNCDFTYNFTGTLPVGEYYFFCVVTATAKDDPTNTASTTSSILKITVSPRSELEGFEGSGTESDPYLIKSVAELKKIDELVMGGNALTAAVFRFANDITIPADYEPIGAAPAENRFSGTIDGAGFTLFYEKGARSMLEFTRDAVVKNMKIYGEEIDGAGILEKAAIDYGDDGVYQETDPDIITVENVTLLSGSKTKGSGLVNGGYTSGINNIFIKNCTVEPGVVIGYTKDQSAIGSFVGTLNGRIVDSVSYATVYGVTDVGGIAGVKGQSMGLCEMVNCVFIGTIEASGGRVGGIMGAGYITHTAPNTPPVTVRNCYVRANITGNTAPNYIYCPPSSGYDAVENYDSGSGIGGIFGSEIGMYASMNNAFICDNYFYGTITDTNPDVETRYDRVGGILGDLGAYISSDGWQHQFYENNYYLSNENYGGFGYLLKPNETWEPETDSFHGAAAAAFTDGTVLTALNGSWTSLKNWAAGEDSFPEHSDAVYPAALALSGKYKTEYFVGDGLDTTGMVFTLTYSDGREETLDISDVEFRGFDTSEKRTMSFYAFYGALNVSFSVTVFEANAAAITVYFTMLGDDVHDSDRDGNVHTLAAGNLQTWIPKTAYTLDENATVLDLIDKALGENGITFDASYSRGTAYIYNVTRNGIDLGEFDNGPNSGWMYTLNGTHPLLGVSEQFLKNGDRIVWHYTDDYTLEEGSSGWDVPVSGETGTATAPEAQEGGVTVTPEVVDGEAKAEVPAEEITGALENNEEAALTLKVETEGAESVELTLPAQAVQAVAEGEKDLTVETEVGALKLDAEALSGLAEGGGDVALTVTKNGDGSTSLYLTAGGEPVEATVKVELPAPEEGQVLVILREDGTEEVLKKSVVENGIAYAEVPAGATVKAADNGKDFGDVKESDWFAGDVAFAASHELFQGMSETEFAPKEKMTRAMLVTVLHRLENEPEAAGKISFADVKEGAWYAKAVAWAAGNGLVLGTDKGFEPNVNVTREQIATILYRYGKLAGMDVSGAAALDQFSDGDKVSAWAKEAMAWAVDAGLFQGNADGSLNPRGDATRAEVAAILQRLVSLMVK